VAIFHVTVVPTNSAASMLMAESGGSILLLNLVSKNRVHVQKIVAMRK